MIKDKTQNQEGGDNSANYQAETINQYGISYRDAKEIALDIFQQNFLILNEQAKQTARERAEELTNKFLDEIKEKNPAFLNSFQEPSMQNALYTAQKSYAISGDKNTADLLVDILFERAKQQERNLLQIVLDECLDVAPKLTDEQLNILSIVFLLTYAVDESIHDLNTLKNYLDEKVKPFVGHLSKESTSYQHLEYCNCSSTSSTQFNSIEELFLQEYTGIFNHGWSKAEVKAKFGMQELPNNLFVPSYYNSYNLQINALTNSELEEKLTYANLPQELTDTVRNVYNNSIMNSNEVREILFDKCDYMQEFIDYWENSKMPRMSLTSVGMALGNANLKRITGEDYDLSLWIK